MWSDLIGQERVKKILQNIYKSGRMAHAYIFYGAEGTGKDAAALEFAKLVNCENPIADSEACGECASCTQAAKLNSTTIKFITALPAGKKETEDDEDPLIDLDEKDFKIYQQEMEKKIADPYYKISIPKANNIRISSIRNIKRSIYLTGSRNKKKVFIISDCDLMNAQSSNSLLKILEEPPGDSLLVLTTSKLNSLLPTIAGRCQKIRFDKLSKENIKNYIKARDNSLTENEYEFFAELSDGSISKANSIMESYLLEQRGQVIELLTSILSKRAVDMGACIDSIISAKDKEKMRQFLLLLIIWFRDLLHEDNSSDEAIINKDAEERLKRFNSNFVPNNYRIICLIEDSIRELEMNINPELIFYRLSHNIRSNILPRTKS